MDIEALRRVNELTKALQMHGISTSSQDALAQAETIIQPIQVLAEQSSSGHLAGESQKITETQTSDALIERKYKLLLEMNNKKFEETFSTLQNNINTLTQEVARLKTELSLLDAKRIIQQQAKSETKQTEQQTQDAKKEAHPRQGNFEPGDVSIEKIFYYGHK